MQTWIRFAAALTATLILPAALLPASAAPSRAGQAPAAAPAPASEASAQAETAAPRPPTSAKSKSRSAAPDAGKPAASRAPIQLVVPFAGAGPSEAVARALAPALARALGEPVELKVLAGAGGTRGTLAVAQSRADGRTLLLQHQGLAAAPALYRALPYRPQRDFSPLGVVVDMPMTLVVRQDFPGRNEADTVWLLRRPQASWLFAYAGLGSASHLCGLLMSQALGADLIQIPYAGTGPALRDLREGRVDLMCDQTINTLAPIRAGEIRAVAVAGEQPLSGLATVPVAEKVGLPGLELTIRHALYLPAGAALADRNRLSRALASARKDPAFVQAMTEAQGVVPTTAVGPDALRQQLGTEARRWATQIRRNGQLAD